MFIDLMKLNFLSFIYLDAQCSELMTMWSKYCIVCCYVLVGRFMPCLKFIVQNAVNKELRLLRGKTIECISLIGLAVSREKVVAALFITKVR